MDVQSQTIWRRSNIERPAATEVGANGLETVLASRILECSRIMLDRRNNWLNPSSDGET